MAHSCIHPCFEALSDADSASIPTAETFEIDCWLKRSLRVTPAQQPPDFGQHRDLGAEFAERAVKPNRQVCQSGLKMSALRPIREVVDPDPPSH
jgi:hypothetical protein